VTNNDILRSFRYALELDNPALLECLALSGAKVSLAELAAMLKHEEEPGFEPLPDDLLQALLDGFVIKLRGKREPKPGEKPEPPARLSNNRVLRSLRIALELKDADMLHILELAGMPVTKAELNALFRREDHRNYQPAGNQLLRNFLKGLALWHRKGRPAG
jgi:uncharacterized protein YehS (DUF1456 family)